MGGTTMEAWILGQELNQRSNLQK